MMVISTQVMAVMDYEMLKLTGTETLIVHLTDMSEVITIMRCWNSEMMVTL